MRDDGDLEQHNGSGSDMKWLNARYILKGETRRTAEEINKGCKILKKKKLRLKSNLLVRLLNHGVEMGKTTGMTMHVCFFVYFFGVLFCLLEMSKAHQELIF